jgi:DNA-directed RNA polymerase I and III subunit RPAC2
MSVNDLRREPTTDIFEVQVGPSEHSSTFIFGNEDHTLGNPLRYVLMRRAETEFCGYSVPHPYEPKMNVRLQTTSSSGATSVEVLKAGLKDLEEAANLIDDCFALALDKYRSNA